MTAPVELYTLEEAAEMLHVTRIWYMRRLRDRTFPGRKVGRNWMLTPGDIEAAVEKMASPAAVPLGDPHGLTRTSRRRVTRRGGAA
ncbi:helix-turn-helix domain-containing protein [Nocardia sp. CA-290969]|uniref:helix-turn-helix domain-containing protein n=1 Tax=Nocardia sp. CA-290969 TaxID=3239986 RepID=UPI003D906867